MTQYNTENIYLSATLLNKLKSATKNSTVMALRLSSNMIDDDETNVPHKLLLTEKLIDKS